MARSGAVADVLPHYRGCAGLSSPRIQAVERAVLAEVGWGLFDCARQGSEEDDGTVRLTVAPADGEQVWAAAGPDRPHPSRTGMRDADPTRREDGRGVRRRRPATPALSGRYEGSADTSPVAAS